MATIFEIQVLGVPASKGSNRAMMAGGGAQLVPGGSKKNQADIESWDSAVRSAVARELVRSGWSMVGDRALRVTITFRLRRPKGHYKPSGDLKASSLGARPYKKPDVDKLVRSTLDAMTGSVFVDDASVTEVMARKRYFDGPEGEGASIKVEIL